MKHKLLAGIIAGVLMVGGMAGVSQAALVDQSSLWQYTTLTQDLWPTWSSVSHSTFDWGSAAWNTGLAAFGNDKYGTPGYLSHNTFWAEGTDLALQKTFSINGTLTSNVAMNIASDNGFVVFINGLQVAKANAEGYTSLWEYPYTVDASYFHSGENIVQAFAEDHGYATYFDLQMNGDVNPVSAVPEPATMMLLGSGLLGMIGLGRKKFLR